MPTNARDQRLEGAGHEPHQDHIAAKLMSSFNSLQSCAQNHFRWLKHLKNPDAKAAVEKEWENWRKDRHGSWRKSETRKKWPIWSKEQGQKSSVCVIGGSLSSWEFGAGTSVSEIQRQGRTPSDDQQFEEEENESVGEMSTVCSQICSEMSVFGSYWEDLIFCGLWTSSRVPQRNGHNLVTNAWRVWSLTFIIQVNTGNFVIRETQHNNAD